MPELPEVETVKRTLLESGILGKTLSVPKILYPKLIKTDLEEFKKQIPDKKIISIDRRGKFLLLHLNDDHRLIFHLRMEGKLFIVDDEHIEKHLSLYIPFKEDEKGLAFYDTRKFGVCYYLKEDEDGPLSSLGPEPFMLDDIKYLKDKYQRSDKPIKELLLDQSIMSGLGNIYADEVCFASSISPYKKGSTLSDKNISDILKNSKEILTRAIENKGSTVKTYKAGADRSGEFQNFLKVYSKDGEICSRCHTFKIEKSKLSGRGTSYCPKCQHTGISLGITGKIASGKTLVISYFKELGYVTFSADDEVKKLYQNQEFLKKLKEKFPDIFTPDLNKEILSNKLITDKQFNRSYQNFLYPIIREKVREFKRDNDGKNKAFEIPLLFESHIDKDMTLLIGTETSYQEEHLKERGEKNIKERIKFNALNSYDKHRGEFDFIINTDGTKKDLFERVKQIASIIEDKLK